MTVKRTLLGILITGVIALAAALSPSIAGTVHALPPAQDPDRPGLTVPDSGPPVHDAGAATDSDQQAYAAASVTASTHLGSEIVISALDNTQHVPTIAYNSKHKEYLVVWENRWGGGGTDIYAQRVTEAGELKSWFTVTTGANNRAQPSVAYDPVNDRYLVVWAYDYWGNGTDWDVYGRFIPWDGPDASLTEFAICTWWPTKQWNPKVAYARAQEEFLVVWWTEQPGPGVPGYTSGRRVKAADGTFPGGGFTIASHLTESRVSPDVAYNLARNEYLVTTDNSVDVYGVRLRRDGVALGTGEFSIAGWPDTETNPAVAACDQANQYMVVWQSSAANSDIYGRFVNGDGTMDVDSVHHFPGTSVAERRPAIACNAAGQHYLVVWEQQYSSLTGPFGIRGQDVSPDKTAGTGFGIMAPTGGITAEFTNPAVAGGGANYLVVWEHDRAGTAFEDIHGRLVSLNALFLPTMKRAAP